MRARVIFGGHGTFTAVLIGAALVGATARAQTIHDGADRAQGARDVLEEVIVTATKRSEKLQDVPVAISAITAEEITTRGFSQYADYLNSVPGVFMEDQGPGEASIKVRGLVAEGGGGLPVATYFGEAITSVITNNGGFADLRLVDIDRVEVLRGPQGTLFGANSLSGVVRIVPAAPNLQKLSVDVGARGFTTAHSGGASYHVEGVLNVPLITDTLALRLVAYKDSVAGYLDNVVPARDALDYSASFGAPAGSLVLPAIPGFVHRDVNSEDTWGLRAALTWHPTDRLRIDATFAHQKVVLDSEPYVQSQFGPYVQQRALDFFEPGAFGDRLDIGTFVVNYDWDAVSLVSATSYTKMTRFDRRDLSFFADNIGFGPQVWSWHNDTEGRVFTQEVRLHSRGPGALQYFLGAFYLNEQTDATQTIGDYSCPQCIGNLLFGQSFAYRYAPGSNPRVGNQHQRSVFGELSYRFAARWTAGVGGRYLEDEIENLTPGAEGFIADPNNGFTAPQPTAKGTNYTFNPSAYLRFQPVADTTVYLEAARGFRSGTPNSALARTGACEQEAAAIGLGAISDPDTLRSYELGFKSLLSQGRLSINAAVYKQYWHGVQLETIQACGFNGTVNGGDATGHGVELETTARLGQHWSLNLSAAYSHNEFDRVKPNVGFSVGERVPGAPEVNGSAGVQYGFALSAQWSGFLRGDYQYVGLTHYKFGEARSIIQAGYGTTNLRLGLQRGTLSVDFFARNVTDNRAVVSTGDPSFGDYQYLLRPRDIGVEVRYSFQ